MNSSGGAVPRWSAFIWGKWDYGEKGEFTQDPSWFCGQRWDLAFAKYALFFSSLLT